MYMYQVVFTGGIIFRELAENYIRGIFREIMNMVFKSHAGNMSANTENFIVVVVFVCFLLLIL